MDKLIYFVLFCTYPDECGTIARTIAARRRDREVLAAVRSAAFKLKLNNFLLNIFPWLGSLLAKQTLFVSNHAHFTSLPTVQTDVIKVFSAFLFH